MHQPIIVPFNGSQEARRAVQIAAHLAAAGNLPVEILSVVPIADLPTTEDLLPLAGIEHRSTAVESEDVAATIVDVLEQHPGALLVLGTHARGPVGELLLGSVSERILARTAHPVVLVGPHVDPTKPLGPALFVAVDDLGSGATAAPFAAAWAQTFWVDPWLLQVIAPADHGRGESNLVHRVARGLRSEGIDAQWDVLHGHDVVGSLVDYVGRMGGGVVAVVSERWTDPLHVHRASTARELVRRSPFPVLVVPARATVPA